MSRCVPYIDLRVITSNYRRDEAGEKVGASRINNVSYMRFLKGDKRRFELDDSIGFGDLAPVNKSTRDDERKVSESNDVSYMDIFGSPQTMANGDINGNSSHGFTSGLANNDNPILEPISSFLSVVTDFTITIFLYLAYLLINFNASAHARKVLPVPAGPEQIVTSFSFIEFTKDF